MSTTGVMYSSFVVMLLRGVEDSTTVRKGA